MPNLKHNNSQGFYLRLNFAFLYKAAAWPGLLPKRSCASNVERSYALLQAL